MCPISTETESNRFVEPPFQGAASELAHIDVYAYLQAAPTAIA